VSAEEANDQGALAKQLRRIHLDVILIEQAETRSAVSDFQGSIFEARSFEFGGRAMHRFDGFARRVIPRRSRFEHFLEFIQSSLKRRHVRAPSLRELSLNMDVTIWFSLEGIMP
jgi:hypothetical protein